MASMIRPNFHVIVWLVIILLVTLIRVAWSEPIPENAELPESIQTGGISPCLSCPDEDFTFLGKKYRVRWYSHYNGKEYPIITHLPDPGDLLKEEVITDANLLETLFLFKKLFPTDLPLDSHYQPYLDFQSEHWESKKEYWQNMVDIWDPNDADWMIGGLYVCNLAASIVLATAGHPTGLLSGVAAVGGVISMTKETLNYIENMYAYPDYGYIRYAVNAIGLLNPEEREALEETIDYLEVVTHGVGAITNASSKIEDFIITPVDSIDDFIEITDNLKALKYFTYHSKYGQAALTGTSGMILGGAALWVGSKTLGSLNEKCANLMKTIMRNANLHSAVLANLAANIHSDLASFNQSPPASREEYDLFFVRITKKVELFHEVKWEFFKSMHALFLELNDAGWFGLCDLAVSDDDIEDWAAWEEEQRKFVEDLIDIKKDIYDNWHYTLQSIYPIESFEVIPAFGIPSTIFSQEGTIGTKQEVDEFFIHVQESGKLQVTVDCVFEHESYTTVATLYNDSGTPLQTISGNRGSTISFIDQYLDKSEVGHSLKVAVYSKDAAWSSTSPYGVSAVLHPLTMPVYQTEPQNDGISSAALIELGEEVQSFILTSSNAGYGDYRGDVDWYKVNVTHPGKLALELTGVSYGGSSCGRYRTIGKIYGPDQKALVTATSTCGNSATSSTVYIDAQDTGYYYIKVDVDYYYSGDSRQNWWWSDTPYRLKADFTPMPEAYYRNEPENDVIEQASLIELNREETGYMVTYHNDGTRDYKGDVDWYRVNVTHPGKLALELTGVSYGGSSCGRYRTIGKIYGPDQKALVTATSTCGNSATSSTVYIDAQDTGYYYIQVYVDYYYSSDLRKHWWWSDTPYQVFLSMELFTDVDTDGDGVFDIDDAFILDPEEWLDTDEDGIGNNADTDDDNDGLSDDIENNLGTDPLDDDSDNDGYLDGDDAFPTDPNLPGKSNAMPWIPLLLLGE